MRPELEKYHLIDQYLNGELEGDALSAFEEELGNDASLKEEVEHLQVVNEVVSGAQIDILRQQMTSDIKAIDRRSLIRKWTMAALCGLALITAVVITIARKENKHDTPPAPVNPHSSPQEKQEDTVAENVTASAGKKTTDSNNYSNTNTASAKDAFPATQDVKDSLQPLTENNDREVTLPSGTVADTGNKVAAPLPDNKPVNDCSVIKITFTPVPLPTCKGESLGSISIERESIHGGSAPYRYSINESTALESAHGFAGLAEGKYVVTITDRNGCLSKREVAVGTRECNTSVKKYNINPDIGETCVIPLRNTGHLMILNRTGNIIFKASVNGSSFEWDGRMMDGATADAGLYAFIIEYTDGTKENGQVTISR